MIPTLTQLVLLKNRIVETFGDIKPEILNKGVTVDNDVSTYADAIRNLASQGSSAEKIGARGSVLYYNKVYYDIETLSLNENLTPRIVATWGDFFMPDPEDNTKAIAKQDFDGFLLLTCDVGTSVLNDSMHYGYVGARYFRDGVKVDVNSMLCTYNLGICSVCSIVHLETGDAFQVYSGHSGGTSRVSVNGSLSTRAELFQIIKIS